MRPPDLKRLFAEIVSHRDEHKCGAYPYQHAQLLTIMAKVSKAKSILELGTGLGYSTIYLARANKSIAIDTIDQNDIHLNLARKNWETFEVSHQIKDLYGKAEAILPELDKSYDLIFFDGYAPSMKFLHHFQRLLRKDGILISANLFVKAESGGKYLRNLNRFIQWQTSVVADTAISVKLT